MRKTKWKDFKFVPIDMSSESRGICHGDRRFVYLCREVLEGRNPVGYSIQDTKFKPGDGGRNAAIDWAGFDEAWANEYLTNPQADSKSRRGILPPSAQQMRRRRYKAPNVLATDVLALANGSPDDIDVFARSLLQQLGAMAKRDQSSGSAAETGA